MSIPVGRKPEPKIIPAACNHLVYFTDPVGLEALKDAVMGADIASVRATATARTTQTSVGKTTALPIASETRKVPSTVSDSVQQGEKTKKSIMLWLIGLALVLIGVSVAVALMKRSESGSQQTSFKQIEQQL